MESFLKDIEVMCHVMQFDSQIIVIVEEVVLFVVMALVSGFVWSDNNKC